MLNVARDREKINRVQWVVLQSPGILLYIYIIILSGNIKTEGIRLYIYIIILSDKIKTEGRHG